MLMLQGSQIRTTEVLNENSGGMQRLPGAIYDERLFTQEGTFEKKDERLALEHCRRVFSDNGEERLVLLVENKNSFVIWIENSSVKPAGPQEDRVKSLLLDSVVAKMRHVNGVKIKDRTYRLKTYPSCFVGSDAVRWFMYQLKLSHEDATRLGQRLMDESWIHHVTDAHKFKDEELFYRFYWDED